MELKDLKQQCQELIEMDDTDNSVFDFKLSLLSSDAEDLLEFHFKILQDDRDEYLKRDLFDFFLIEKQEASKRILFAKYIPGIEDVSIKAVIQLLGHLQSKYAGAAVGCEQSKDQCVS